MQIKDSVAFVTGANRGLGAAFVSALLTAGARKVYAAARAPFEITDPRLEYVQLDVTNVEDITAAAKQSGDVDLLINNAGVSLFKSFLSDDAAEAARIELETNYIGPLVLSQAFAPILARNGGGAIVNVLSVVSWLNARHFATYSASKAAAWSLTNGLRNELRAQGTQVMGVHVGFMDTDMVRDITLPKSKPEDVTLYVLQSLEAGNEEALADAFSRETKRGLSSEPAVYLAPR